MSPYKFLKHSLSIGRKIKKIITTCATFSLFILTPTASAFKFCEDFLFDWDIQIVGTLDKGYLIGIFDTQDILQCGTQKTARGMYARDGDGWIFTLTAMEGEIVDELGVCNRWYYEGKRVGTGAAATVYWSNAFFSEQVNFTAGECAQLE